MDQRQPEHVGNLGLGYAQGDGRSACHAGLHRALDKKDRQIGNPLAGAALAQRDEMILQRLLLPGSQPHNIIGQIGVFADEFGEPFAREDAQGGRGQRLDAV